MKYLLDTNAVIALLKGEPTFLARLTRHRPEDFSLSAIVAHELHYGAFRSARRDQNLVRLAEIPFPIVEFDAEDARCSGELRAELAAAGKPIGPYDVLIAGQALARVLTLVTHNTREFGRIPHLKVEDWQA